MLPDYLSASVVISFFPKRSIFLSLKNDIALLSLPKNSQCGMKVSKNRPYTQGELDRYLLL